MIDGRCRKEPRPGFELQHLGAYARKHLFKVALGPAPQTPHALRLAGRARGIAHQRAHHLARGNGVGSIYQRGPFRCLRVGLCGGVINAIGLTQRGIRGDRDDRAPFKGGAQRVDQVTVDDHELRAAVVTNGAGLFCRSVPVLRHDDRAGHGRGAHNLELGQIVAHDQRHRHIRARPQMRQCRSTLRRALFKRLSCKLAIKIRNHRIRH